MGIKDLNKFIKIHVPEAVTQIDLSTLSGSKIAIDTSIYLYKYLYKNDYFIEGFLQQIYRLTLNGITPIYVFDGIPPKEKKLVLISRKHKRDNLELKKKDLQTKYLEKVKENDKKGAEQLNIQIKKIEKKNIRITSEHIIELKRFFNLLGIKFIHPNCEADTFCNVLYYNKIVDYCMSDDMDLLASGCKKLIRNFNISYNSVSLYNLDVIFNKMQLNSNEWIDMCILCGCDYTIKLKGINHSNSYELIKKYKNIENIIKNLKDNRLQGDMNINKFNYKSARNIFNEYKEITTKIQKYQITIPSLWGNQKDEIMKYLRSRTRLNCKQLSLRINKIYKLKY